ncbi:GNAT family N-acetyltransferase [Paenibacillus athensensis]|nr:GNAT family N-acetyltransferase [Paenibacillus athensensis]MCD1259069.1 GNAT family N-acetyltransferase [Paenibacillus athensensis]
MHIRPAATMQDIDDAYAIEQAGYPPEAAASREAFGFRFRTFGSYFFVAEEEGGIVGVANGVRLDDPDLADEGIKQAQGAQDDGAYFCLLTVVVDQQHRGRGVASALLAAVIAQAQSDRLHGIALMCEEPLIPFYERFGFCYIRRSASQHGSIVWHEMKLDLPRFPKAGSNGSESGPHSSPKASR